jgi:hypothetical protein
MNPEVFVHKANAVPVRGVDVRHQSPFSAIRIHVAVDLVLQQGIVIAHCVEPGFALVRPAQLGLRKAVRRCSTTSPVGEQRFFGVHLPTPARFDVLALVCGLVEELLRVVARLEPISRCQRLCRIIFGCLHGRKDFFLEGRI